MLLALLLTPLSMPAIQGDTLPGYRLYCNTSTWDTGESSVPFRTLQGGYLRRLDQRDLVTLRGSELQVLLDVATRDTVQRLASGVTGLVLLPGQGPAVAGGNLDALLSVDASGARKWTWNAATGQFGSSVLAQLSSWAGASELRLGPAGTLFARAAMTNTILRASVSNGAIASVTPSLKVTGAIRDYEAFYWNTDAVVDLAVLTSSQLIVRSTTSWSGNLLPGNYTVSSNDLLAVSRGTAPERDLLLWYTEVGGVGYLNAGNDSRIDPTLDLGTTCGALECFRFGRDGVSSTRQDAFFSLRASRDLVQLQRLAPQPVGSYSFWLPTYASGALAPYLVENDQGTTTIPAIGTASCGFDIDGDGDDDIVSGLHDREQIQVLQNTRYDRLQVGAPDVLPGNLTPVNVDLSDYSAPWAGSFQFARRNSDATHLHFEVRYQTVNSDGSYNPGADCGWAESLGSGAPARWDIPLPSGTSGYAPFHFQLNGNGLDGAGLPTGTIRHIDVFQFTLYEIKLDTAGNELLRYPAATYFYSFAGTTEDAYMELPEIRQYHPGWVPNMYDFAANSGGTVIGGRGLGGGP